MKSQSPLAVTTTPATGRDKRAERKVARDADDHVLVRPASRARENAWPRASPEVHNRLASDRVMTSRSRGRARRIGAIERAAGQEWHAKSGQQVRRARQHADEKPLFASGDPIVRGCDADSASAPIGATPPATAWTDGSCSRRPVS